VGSKIAKVLSSVPAGIAGRAVEVEVDVANGLPHFSIVGLPGGAVREAKDRVRAAIRHSGFELPDRRYTVNLAPAQVRKEGAALDLAIAFACLIALETLPAEAAAGLMVVGELALDGRVKPVHGALPIALAARRGGVRRLVVPAANTAEASLGHDGEVVGVADLAELAGLATGRVEARPEKADAQALLAAERKEEHLDFADVRGQAAAKRALEVAAAGGHASLLVGPPGAGKTMLARRLPGILPEPTLAEALEVTAIHSVAGLLGGRPLLARRPFRAPHHTTSAVALVGGGRPIRPGEVTLAHRGVLFLDELPEFPVRALESLRQPLEERAVHVSRAAASESFPADALVVAAMNPCPCGYAGEPTRVCSCPAGAPDRYRQRLSGPLLDRFDLHVEVPAVPYADLMSRACGEPSWDIAARVRAARDRQAARFARSDALNAHMTAADLVRHCALEPRAIEVLERAADRLALSARACGRVLKVARTLADLGDSDRVRFADVAEALQYRPDVRR
jgi:magnesium chelatase family protein